MKQLLSFAARFPFIVASIIFLIIAFPINYMFLSDHPNNALEQAEEAVIRSLTGLNVDLNPDD